MVAENAEVIASIAEVGELISGRVFVDVVGEDFAAVCDKGAAVLERLHNEDGAATCAEVPGARG